MSRDASLARAPAPQQYASLRIEGLTALDALIFNRDDWDMLPEPQALPLRVAAIQDALRHHAARCAPYARFCARLGFDPARELTPDRLIEVPQLPSSVFKTVELRSVPQAEVVRCFESSGTSGARSKIARDDATLARLAASLRGRAHVWSDVVGDIDVEEELLVVHLGPSRRDAGSVWFGYVMSLIELDAETHHLLRGGRLDLDEALACLRQGLAGHARVLLVGAPYLVEQLCRRAERGAIEGGARLFVVTGGGWKRHAQRALGREQLARYACEALGLSSPEQVRDVFNQVELNSAFVQCRHGRLHVPPWVEVIVRDPETLAPLAPGELGLLSYLDPSASSYPAFFIGEDLGTLERAACACGRPSAGVNVLRRLRISSHLGCASQLEAATSAAPEHGGLP